MGPEKPWFLWLAFGACHAPHHVPKEWIEKYKGKFDHGWDKDQRRNIWQDRRRLGIVPENTELAPPNEGVQKWDDLSADEKRLFARYDGVLCWVSKSYRRADWTFYSILEKIGKIENTLIFVCSDNGASAEGMQTGLFNEVSFFNAEPETVEKNLGKIDELGGPTCYNHYPVDGPWLAILHSNGTNSIRITAALKIHWWYIGPKE